MFSIIIPPGTTLRCCNVHRSIRQHSAYAHQIIVHVNDGSDGTLAWVREQASCTPLHRRTSASALR